MRSLTLVAGYGSKTPALEGLLRDCQARLAQALGPDFRPCPLPQIHATLVGLESDPLQPDRHRLARSVGTRVKMDVRGFLEHLIETWQPLHVRFGGFRAADRAFTSRRATPFARSFSLQGDMAVLIGWPVAASTGSGTLQYPEALERIRRGARRFGIVHAYHVEPHARDNDCYLRVGRLEDSSAPGPERLRSCEADMRTWLSRATPVIASLSLRDLSVVRYSDEALPQDTSEACDLTDESRWLRWLGVSPAVGRSRAP